MRHLLMRTLAVIGLSSLLSFVVAVKKPHSNEEYDSKILDPMTVFGSPYGGFSRATRSRLSALPLRLPDIAIMDDDDDDEVDSNAEKEDDTDGNSSEEEGIADNKKKDTLDSTFYMETSDGMGQGYICRVYHEDALEPESLSDSLFDTPILDSGEDDDEDEENRIEEDDELNHHDDDDEGEEEESVEKRSDGGLMETQRRLKKLEGVCSQIHLGWWSYEWCYDQSVTQFHIHVDATSSGLELRDVTSLGKFAKRKFQMAHEFGSVVGDDDGFPPNNKYAEDELELARVVDSYREGDICDATGEPRKTNVKYLCCSERLMKKYEGPVLRNGNPISSKIATLVNLVEDPQEVCSYTITVCTPLMCEEVKSDDDDGLLFDIVAESAKKKRSGLSKTGGGRHHHHHNRDKETIRDLLDRVLGKACVQSSTTSGWWSYEYCHRKHVRQFHESISINVETGLATAGTEDIYMLGFYDADLDAFPDEDEWKYLVNTTLSPSGATSEGSSTHSGTATGGGGAGRSQVVSYLTAEYTGGDVCDDSDVTDAAIKAGSVGGGHIARSCSIRYACGSAFDVRVNEDHTCHYIVEVSIPDLCSHPLFKVPVAKKRVVKCVPVEDSSEWDH